MNINDSVLLEKAYLSISQKLPSVPSDKEPITTAPNDVVSAGPMDEPAPQTDTLMVGSQPEGGIDPSMSSPMDSPMDSPMSSDPRLDLQDENEEDSMAIDNLNSIRESIMKIAKYCSGGGHIEPWQQQKLAISMDNLAEVARSIR
jgi:hypothetical protein